MSAFAAARTSATAAGRIDAMAAARTTPRVVALGRSLGHARRAAAMAPLQAVKKVGNRLVKQVEVNDNGKAARVKMHVRVGDTVKVIAGKDKGKVGEVVKVFRKGAKAGRILVSDVNLAKKHQKPQPGSEEEEGRIILTEVPLHHSNVMLYSTKEEKVSRVGKVIDPTTGKKLRVLVKTGETLAERLPQKKPKDDEGTSSD